MSIILKKNHGSSKIRFLIALRLFNQFRNLKLWLRFSFGRILKSSPLMTMSNGALTSSLPVSLFLTRHEYGCSPSAKSARITWRSPEEGTTWNLPSGKKEETTKCRTVFNASTTVLSLSEQEFFALFSLSPSKIICLDGFLCWRFSDLKKGIISLHPKYSSAETKFLNSSHGTEGKSRWNWDLIVAIAEKESWHFNFIFPWSETHVSRRARCSCGLSDWLLV